MAGATTGVAILALHCSLLATSDLKLGVGEPCASDDQCQAARCDQGTCASACTTDGECPSPSICLVNRCRLACRTDDHCTGGTICLDSACTPPLKIAALFPGLANGEDGWSTAHRLALDEATARLPYARYGDARYAYREVVRSSEDALRRLDQYVAEGANVIVTTSSVGEQAVRASAPKYPGVKFLTAGAIDNHGLSNVGAYNGRAEQEWYIAGRLAARVATTDKKCIGIVLPTPTKAIVRETNAFVRGARFQEPTIKVVIRWLGATKDFGVARTYDYDAVTYDYKTGNDKLFREELLAAQIADLGCSLVAHRTETQRVVNVVEQRLLPALESLPPSKKHLFFSLGTDVRYACNQEVKLDGKWIESCLGAVYWNWGDVYTKAFDQIRRDVWSGLIDQETFRAAPDAITQFELNPNSSLTGIGREEAQHVVVQTADDGFDAVFRGPYSFNGQRDLDGDGKADAVQSVIGPVSNEELARMCWFVEGTYELPDPTKIDYATLIPALVPYGPSVPGGTSTLDISSFDDTTKYGDVLDYLRIFHEDAPRVMSCALN